VHRRDYLNTKFGRTGNLDDDINYNGYKAKLSSFDVSTDTNSAVFYSGDNGLNRARARIFAQEAGKKVIEMTPGGNWLNQEKIYNKLPANLADSIWQSLSIKYANNAEGEVFVFANNADPTRVFLSTELPLLESSPKVTGIIGLNELPEEYQPRFEQYLKNKM
jgi:hypothetical protein